MEFSDEEALDYFNRLLERLHQAGNGFGGNMTFVYVAKGAQHVGNIQTQNVYVERRQEPIKINGPQILPNELNTETAMIIWRKAQDAGYIDENYQPLLSRTLAALLAHIMAERLKIKEKWKVFETLWQRKNMYRDYYKALNLQQSLTFQDSLKALFQ